MNEVYRDEILCTMLRFPIAHLALTDHLIHVRMFEDVRFIDIC